MGDDKRPDQDMPIEVILEVQATLERDLLNSQTVEQMIRVCVQAVFIICGFCAELRGEELPMTSLDAMAKHYKKDQLVEGSLENVFLALRGRVKGEHSEDTCHLIPIAATTEGAETDIVGWEDGRSLPYGRNHQWLGVSK
jgi:hypothetical protein